MYKIEYLAEVFEDIESLSQAVRLRGRRVIEDKLTSDPISFGKPLRYGLKGSRSLRVGDYRAIFIIEQDVRIVLVTKIAHRRAVYQGE